MGLVVETGGHRDLELRVPAPEKSQLGRAAPTPQLTGTTVLVVEDNEMVRNLLSAALTSDGRGGRAPG